MYRLFIEVSSYKLRRILPLALITLLLFSCQATPSPLETPYRYQPLIPDSTEILANAPESSRDWSAEDLDLLKELWLGSLPLPPSAPSNRVADDPRAAALGHRLFFDARLSANQQIACATCHLPELSFTDGQPVAHGTRPTERHTMTLLGAAYSPWLLWDGGKDSLWAQALHPIEAPDEQGATRLHALHLVGKDQIYRTAYETIFGALPALSDFNRFPDAGGPVEHPPYRAAWDSMTAADQALVTEVYVNLGKSIAAYERLLLPGPSRFDQFVQAILQAEVDRAAELLAVEEVAGLRLFLGHANCIQCHHGPLFTDHQFHNTGTPPGDGLPSDEGRATGTTKVLADEFNCFSLHSDAAEGGCQHLSRLVLDDESQRHAFRTPTLRNVAETAPYMHAGQFTALQAVLDHYNHIPATAPGPPEIHSLNLSDAELAQLEAFLRTLSGPLATPAELLKSPGK